MENLRIIKAGKSDAKEISDLILGVAHFFTLDPNGIGAERFLEYKSPESIEAYIDNQDIDYNICRIDIELAGIIAVKERTHLLHLFVSPKFQRMGVASALWNYARFNSRDRYGITEFTVNSTPYAVPVYNKFGFIVTGPRVEKDGISFIPMKLTSNSSNTGLN